MCPIAAICSSTLSLERDTDQSKGTCSTGTNQNRVPSNPHVLKQEKKSEKERRTAVLLPTVIDAILIYSDMILHWGIFRLGFSTVETWGQFPQANTQQPDIKLRLWGLKCWWGKWKTTLGIEVYLVKKKKNKKEWLKTELWAHHGRRANREAFVNERDKYHKGENG